MTFNVAMLKQMRAEGLDFDAAIRVLEAGEKKADNTNSERQARYRANRKAAKDSNAVTVTPVTPPNDIDILTPHEVEKTEPKGSSKSLVQEEKRKAVGSCLQTAFVIPDDIPAEPWAAWVEMRIRMRKKPTPHACSLAVAELRRLRDEEGWPPGDVLNHCTMNSYQGIFPPKRGRNERSDRDPTTVALERLIGNVGTHARTG
jgi:hypothetical protein